MKSTSHGSHLVQLTRLGAVNAYLVREEDGLTLVDTGLPGSGADILAAADALGTPIVRIVLTHDHLDHVGSLDALATKLPDVPVLASAREARLIAGEKAMDAGEPPLKGHFPTPETTVTLTLEPGETVGSLEAIAAPGHTPGQIALLDTRDRTLIAGDAYSTLGGIATAAKPNWRFPLPALASWHRPTALMTARTLRELDPARLAVGHGPVIESPGPAMEEALRKAAA
jgi:glyoxylase-like metal-dependent hydrolase (beta-lactamase superfamily II)